MAVTFVLASAWSVAMVLVVIMVTTSCEGVTIKGFPTSSRCRSGQQIICQNVAVGACCDFIQNNQAVLGVLYEGIRPGQWMSTHRPQPNSGCGDLRDRRQFIHGAPRSFRCIGGDSITGAKWHRNQPASLLAVDTLSQNSTEGCTEIVKAVPMIWNSTLREYTLVR